MLIVFCVEVFHSLSTPFYNAIHRVVHTRLIMGKERPCRVLGNATLVRATRPRSTIGGTNECARSGAKTRNDARPGIRPCATALPALRAFPQPDHGLPFVGKRRGNAGLRGHVPFLSRTAPAVLEWTPLNRGLRAPYFNSGKKKQFSKRIRHQQ